MKRILLLIRLVVEAMVGLICMTGLLLLPGIWRGESFLGALYLDAIGYLGMPYRYHPYLTGVESSNLATKIGSLFGLSIVLLIGALCFKDILKITRKLRAKHHES